MECTQLNSKHAKHKMIHIHDLVNNVTLILVVQDTCKINNTTSTNTVPRMVPGSVVTIPNFAMRYVSRYLGATMRYVSRYLSIVLVSA